MQTLRIRIATAESKLKVLREEARQTKRRRKEAKRLAQRARKLFKRFKAELADLRQVMAKAEVKLFESAGRVLARNMKKGEGQADRQTCCPPPEKVEDSRAQARTGIASQASRATRKKPASTKVEVASDGPADIAALDHTPPTPQLPRLEFVNL